ncbi:MAG TPA: sucrase ferredoxin [Mycobacteriales bacterium]|nr:sucrase ferredoxin [Mycobacteriales bacterium]
MTTPEPLVRSELRCSFAAERRGDHLAGTAAPAAGLLLVEQPGPWGRVALTQSRLDPEIGAQVAARAAAHGVRTLVIRHPGRPPATHGPRRWAVVDCSPGEESTTWGTYGADAELLDVPLDGSAGERSDAATYLVCTHGRHDACCAIRGRPIATALAALRPGHVWECSHVGGDRFAANVLALPHGLYYGRVDDASVHPLVAAHERGEVLPPLLRGRTTFSGPIQAAQQRARELTGRVGINDLLPASAEPTGDGGWRVVLQHDPQDLAFVVRAVAAGPAVLLTCGAATPAHPPRYAVEPVTPAS